MDFVIPSLIKSVGSPLCWNDPTQDDINSHTIPVLEISCSNCNKTTKMENSCGHDTCSTCSTKCRNGHDICLVCRSASLPKDTYNPCPLCIHEKQRVSTTPTLTASFEAELAAHKINIQMSH